MTKVDRYCIPCWFLNFVPLATRTLLYKFRLPAGKNGCVAKKKLPALSRHRAQNLSEKGGFGNDKAHFSVVSSFSAIFEFLWQGCGHFKQNLRQNPFLQNPTECWAHARTCSHSLALCSHSLALCSHSARALLALARTRSHSLALCSHSARTTLALFWPLKISETSGFAKLWRGAKFWTKF